MKATAFRLRALSAAERAETGYKARCCRVYCKQPRTHRASFNVWTPRGYSLSTSAFDLCAEHAQQWAIAHNLLYPEIEPAAGSEPERAA